MAFDVTGFFTIVGRGIAGINEVVTCLSTLETAKSRIQTSLEEEGLHDLTAPLPGIFSSGQSSLTSIIQSVINFYGSTFFTDRDYVIENLPTSNFDTASILGALYEYMVTNTETILASVVTIGGSDANWNATAVATTNIAPRLYATRTLDGVNSPGNGVVADARYVGIEGQLAKTTTIYAEVTSVFEGQETAQIYSLAEETPPYVIQDEEPGVGPVYTNPEAVNLVLSNYNFSEYTSQTPNGWSVTGGVETTDWLDSSGSGAGPLKVKTNNVKATQKLENLEKNRMYYVGVLSSVLRSGGSTTGTVGVKIRNSAATVTYLSQQTNTIATSAADKEHYGIAYGFFYLPDSANLDDVYVEIQVTDAADSGGEFVKVRKCVLIPVTYYNGLGVVWWPHIRPNDGYNVDVVTLRERCSLACANNDSGLFQSFFRKAFNVQLPTSDSPTISEDLVTLDV